VVFIKHTTDSLGADVCIDAVGAEAAGSALQTVLGRKVLMQGGRPPRCTGRSTP
jgi:hypothetical protein